MGRYGAMTLTHVRGSNAILVVYDLTRPHDSLEAVRRILEDVDIEDALVFLIGNKSDMFDNTNEDSGVSKKAAMRMGQRFADQNSMLFFETSAKTAKNVKRLVISLTRSLLALHRSLHSRQVSAANSVQPGAPQLMHRDTVEIN